MQFAAGDLDLDRIGEVIAGSQQLSGKLNGGVKLRGTAEGLNTLAGTGALWLREADLYRLPQMIARPKIEALHRFLLRRRFLCGLRDRLGQRGQVHNRVISAEVVADIGVGGPVVVPPLAVQQVPEPVGPPRI